MSISSTATSGPPASGPTIKTRILLASLPFAGIILVILGALALNFFHSEASSQEAPPSPVVTPEPLGNQPAPKPTETQAPVVEPATASTEDRGTTPIEAAEAAPPTVAPPTVVPEPLGQQPLDVPEGSATFSVEDMAIVAADSATSPLAVPDSTPLAPPADATLVAVAPVAPENSPEEDFLERVERQYAEIASIRAEITQRKYSDVFLEEVVADADLLVKKPGLLRIFYRESPNWDGSTDNSKHWMYEDHYWRYLPDFNQIEKYPVGQTDSSVEQINIELLSFDLDSAEVFRAYDVDKLSEAPAEDGGTSITFELRPLEDENLVLLRLSFAETPAENEVAPAEDADGTTDSPKPPMAEDATKLIISHVFYEEKSGDTTDIRFQEIIVNPELNDADFEPAYPSDATLIEH